MQSKNFTSFYENIANHEINICSFNNLHTNGLWGKLKS